MGFILYNLICLWCIIYRINASLPLKFGENYGDKTLGYGDDTTKKIVLDGTIRIYDKKFNTFYVSFNGGIFQTSYTRIALNDLWTDFPEYSILPYWADANFLNCNGCNVFFRRNVDTNDLNTINRLVKLFHTFDNDFHFGALRKETFVVTWANAPSYKEQGKYKNIFQAIITSNGTDTYAIFGYEQLEYPDVYDIYPKIGYFISGQKVCGLADNIYNDLPNLPCKSNVYTPGVFVLHLTSTKKHSLCEGSIFAPTCTNCGSSTTTFCTEDDIKQKFEVCTSKNVKYENKCELKKALCHARGGFTIKKCENIGGECGDIGVCHEKAVCRYSSSGQYRCECLPGFDGDGKNCLDINECASKPCKNNQVCEDLENDYLCKCQNPWTGKNCELFKPCEENNGGCEETCGYDSNLNLQCFCSGKPLSKDQKNCVTGSFAVVGLVGNIFYDNINTQTIHELPIKGQDLNVQNFRVTGLDIDYKNEVIYFMDSGSFSILKIQMNGLGLQTLIQGREKSDTFDDLVYDSDGRYIFWSEHLSVFRYSLDTGQIIEVFKSKNEVRSLVLLKEHCKRRIYWSESKLPTPGIRYTNIDNPAVTPVTVVDTWIYLPQGLAANHDEQKIYWIDNFFHRIESINYDGSCRKLLTESLPNFAFGLAYYNNALYFSHWESSSLRKYDLSDGKNETLAVYDGRSFGVKIYNPKQTYSCENIFKCVSDETSECDHENCVHGSCNKLNKCVCNIGFKGVSCDIQDDTFNFSRLHVNVQTTGTLQTFNDKNSSIFIQTISNTSLTNSYIMQNGNNSFISSLYLQTRDNELNNVLQIINVKHNIDSKNTFLNKNHLSSVIANEVQCIFQQLATPFNSIPFILVNQESHVVENSSPTWHLQIWLRNVKNDSFLICFQELIRFSGVKNITLHYLAITEQSTIFNEIGLYTPNQMKFEQAVSYCHDINFTNTYQRPPYVFLTPEVLSDSARIISWVNHVTSSYLNICYQSSTSFTEEKILKLHYAVRAADDPCENITCSNLKSCYEDEFGIGKCLCHRECDDVNENSHVCSKHGNTYKSLCEFTKFICENNGGNEDNDEIIIYDGKCKDFTYEYNKIALDVDPHIPIAFCKNVTIDTANFKATMPFQVQMSVTWEDVANEISFHDASASWFQQVSYDGFKLCAVVAGRNVYEELSPPSINWFTYQVLMEGVLSSGTIQMESWYSGSRCSIIDLPQGYHDINSTMLISVEHTLVGKIENSVTSWIEKAEINNDILYRVCARELQNFDGKHEGLKMHWIVLTTDQLKGDVIFGNQELSMDQYHMGAPKCMKVHYDETLEKTPQVHITAILKISIEKFRANVNVSDNDASIWIERSTVTYFEFCCKSIRSSLFQHRLQVSYLVFNE